MNQRLLDQIVAAILYEGYLLDPRPSNPRQISRGRFTFGRVYPRAYSEAREGAEPYLMQSECVLQHREDATVDVRVRFLHPLCREVYAPTSNQPPAFDRGGSGKPAYYMVPRLVVGGRCHETWQETVEREVCLSSVRIQAGRYGWVRTAFSFPAMSDVELLSDGRGGVAGAVVRRQEALSGTVEVLTQPARAGCMKIRVRILNETPTPCRADSDTVMMRTLASTHIILKAHHGAFLSLVYAGEFQELVNTCENIGTWPVLVGDQDEQSRDTMVSSPVMLSDYPGIALEGGKEDSDAGGGDGDWGAVDERRGTGIPAGPMAEARL
jgi:hydrogenase maturation protease